MRLFPKIIIAFGIIVLIFSAFTNTADAQFYNEVPDCVPGTFGLRLSYRSESYLLDCHDQVNAAHYDVTHAIRNGITVSDIQGNPVDLAELEYELRAAKEEIETLLAEKNPSQYSNGVPDGQRAQLEVERQLGHTRVDATDPNSPDYQDALRNRRDTTNAAVRQQLADATGDEVTYECTWTGGVINCVNAIIVWVGNIAVYIVSVVLWIANEILNYAITLSIRDFSQYVNDNNGITTAWQAVRDIINISFIFILLYVAIGAMFSLFSYKKVLVNVIIVALLINFSAILPKVIIDASNILALEFYDRIGDGETFTGAPDVTKTIVANLGLTLNNGDDIYDKYSKNETPQLPHPNLSSLALIAGIFGKIIFLLVTAVILAVAAWMFILRTIVLIFLIVLSPAAVAAYMLPATQKYFSQWFQRLLNEAFFAPAYLFMLYIVISIVKGTNLQSLAGGNIKTDSLFDADVIKITLNFIIITVMMGAALMIARQMGASGAGTATKWAGKAKGLGLGFLGGTASLAGAYSLGKVGQKISENKWLKEKSAGKTFSQLGGLARFTKGMGDKMAGAKYGSTSYTERTKKAAERIEGFKTPELQSKYLASLRPVDREEAWGKLSDRQRSYLNAEALKLPDADPRRKAIEGLVAGMSYEDREKMDKSAADAGKQKAEAEARLKAQKAIDLLTTGKTRKVGGYRPDLAGKPDESKPEYERYDSGEFKGQYKYQDIQGNEVTAGATKDQLIQRIIQDEKTAHQQIATTLKAVPVGSAGQLKKALSYKDKDKDGNETVNNDKKKVAKMIVQNMDRRQLLKLFAKDADLDKDQIDLINEALNDTGGNIPTSTRDNIDQLKTAANSHPVAKTLGIEIINQNNPASPSPNRVILTDSRGNPIT